MFRSFWLGVVFLLMLAGCGGETQESPPPTATPVLPTRTPSPSPTPRQMVATPSPRSTHVPTATEQIPATQAPAALPDFSGVTLYEATHLMDPRMFQVSMDGWPADVPEDVVVRVGLEFYTCDILFPDQFPNRVYCWGFAPPKGTDVTIQVILEDLPKPLLEIPFRVPYPSDEGS